jgi:hypothetical protein
MASSRLNVISEEDADRSVRSRMDLQNDRVFGRHVGALFKKRAVNFQRDKKAWCCTTILPVVFVTIGFLVFRFASVERNLSPLTLDLSALNPDVEVGPINPIPVNSPNNAYACQPGVCAYDPVVSSGETNERYTYCGTQAHLTADLDVAAATFFLEPARVQCSVSESADVLGTLNGFQGAQLVETPVSGIQNVSPFSCCYCFDVDAYSVLPLTLDVSAF